MEQDKIDSLTRLISSRTGSDKERRELQDILRTEAGYTGKSDGDIGWRSARSMVQVFRDQPALLNNTAPWLIKALETEGYGKELREMVAANPLLRAQLVESTLKIVDTDADAHREMQAKLSLLNLYNYKDGIDGVRGGEHKQAVKDLKVLADTIKKEAEKKAAAVEKIPGSDAMRSPPSPPPAMVTPPPVAETKTETAPAANPGPSFSDLSKPGDPIVDRLADIIEIPKNLRDSFGRSVRSTDGLPIETPHASPLNASLAGPTIEEQKRIMARFLTNGSNGRGLAFFDVLAKETKGDGDYDMVNGGKRVGLRGKTVDGVLKWQEERKKEQLLAANKAEKEARKEGVTDENEIKAIRAKAVERVGSTGAGINQVMHKNLKSVKEELGLSGKEPFDEAMQHTITAVLLVRRGYPRWLLSDGKPRDESRIMNSLPGEWAAFQNSKGAGVHDGVGNNKAYVTPDEMLTALRRDREAFQQYLKDPTLVAEDQRKAFKELIEVSDTIARPKGKGRDNRAEADTDPAGTFALAKAELDRNAATTQSSDGGPSLTPSLDPVRKGPPVA